MCDIPFNETFFGEVKKMNKKNVWKVIFVIILLIFAYFANNLGIESNRALDSCGDLGCWVMLFLIVLSLVLLFYLIKYIIKTLRKK